MASLFYLPRCKGKRVFECFVTAIMLACPLLLWKIIFCLVQITCQDGKFTTYVYREPTLNELYTQLFSSAYKFGTTYTLGNVIPACLWINWRYLKNYFNIEKEYIVFVLPSFGSSISLQVRTKWKKSSKYFPLDLVVRAAFLMKHI